MHAAELVRQGKAQLAAAGVPEAGIKTEWWMAEVLGVGRAELPNASVSEDQVAQIEAGFVRLAKHEPLQYVIGHTPFLHIDVRTDARALIPRPETEELASRILGCDELWSRPEVHMADVGTGTGCIALALVTARANARVIGVDRSADALALARASAAAYDAGDRLVFRQGDLLEGIAAGSLDAVVSNPPYIATDAIAGLDASVSRFEPAAALDGGTDGLAVIRRLVLQAFTALRKDGRLWLEIGDEQGEAMAGLLAAAGFHRVAVSRDLYGQVRFAEGTK